MKKNGWVGYPILTISDDIALTGSHRIAAVEIADICPETYNISLTREDIYRDRTYWAHDYDDEHDWYFDIPLTDEGNELVEAIDQLTSQEGDDRDRLLAIKHLHTAGLVSDYALWIMQAEYDNN